MPRVSVIVPNYNHARFLKQRLDSILNQTFQDFELIILDDASTDNSREVIQAYAGHPRVRCLFNGRNSGNPFAQWGRGVQEARGEYIWIAESDDYAAETLLEKLGKVLAGNPGVGLAYCQTYDVTEEGKIFGTAEEWAKALDPVRWSRDFTNHGPDECARYLVYRNVIVNASAVLVRKALVQPAIPEACGFRMAGDWFVWAKCLSQADVAFRAEPLNYHRHHAGTVRTATSRLQLALETARVKSWICRNLPVRDQVRRDIARESFVEVRQFSGDLRGRQLAAWLGVAFRWVWPLHRRLVLRLCLGTLWEVYATRARQFRVRWRIRLGAERRKLWRSAKALARR